MLILDEDSFVESEQYAKEQEDMGQSEQGHNDDKAGIEEIQEKVQEKETETYVNDEEYDAYGQFDDDDYKGVVFV